MPGLLPNIDPDGLLEFSVVYTDRALNHMSKRFVGVVQDILSTLKSVYHAHTAVLVPGSGTFGMEAVARQFANKEKVLIVRNGWFSFRWSQIFDAGGVASASIVCQARKQGEGPQAPWVPCPAEEVAAKIRAERPKDTMLNQMWIPVARAAGLLQSGKYDAVVAELEVASRFERAGRYLPQYIRGLAYLHLNRKSDAVNEFNRILENRGESPLSPVYPLTQLAKARALGSRDEYDKFFAIWQDADPDMPALIAARSEYEAL